MFVADTSVVLHLAREGVDVRREWRLHAPTLLRSEVLSTLHEAVTRGDMTAAMGRDLHRVREMPIRLLGDAVLQRRRGSSPTSSAGRRPTRRSDRDGLRDERCRDLAGPCLDRIPLAEVTRGQHALPHR